MNCENWESPDMLACMDEEFDRVWLRWTKLLALFVIGVAIGYTWAAVQTPETARSSIEYRQVFNSEADRLEFNRLLVKHGLQHDVSIVYEDHLGPYYIRNGQRCAFR